MFKKSICLVLVLCAVICTIAAIPFTDSDRIPLNFNKLGILQGTGTGFSLTKPLTRAEAVSFLLRVCPFDAKVYENKFSDLENHWSKNAVSKAVSLGFVKGTTDTSFEPDRKVTGREFAEMLLVMMGYTNVTSDNTYETADNAQLITDKYIKEIVSSDAPITRSDALRVIYSALTTSLSDGRLLKNALVEAGKFKAKDFSFMGCGVPAADLSFEDRINSKMPKDKNYIFSPYSAKVAFAMAANGADGITKEEMLSTLGIDDLDAFNQLTKQISDCYKKAETLKIESANAIYLNESKAKGINFLDSYVNTISEFYDGKAGFVNDSNAVKTVNSWVNEKTKGRIPEILQNSNFVSLLVNAVYFKGGWQKEFPEYATKERDFYQQNGEVKKTDFMHTTASFSYAENNGVKIIDLPYKPDINARLNISMFILMGEGDVENPCKVLESAEFSSTRVNLAMPKFKIETTLPLKQTMVDLGMKTAFSQGDSIMPFMLNENAFLMDALQKAFIEVDEKGTEAAAVTALMVGATSAPKPEEPIDLILDKPFTYIIKDKTNNQVLFMGKFAFVE